MFWFKSRAQHSFTCQEVGDATWRSVFATRLTCDSSVQTHFRLLAAQETRDRPFDQNPGNVCSLQEP